MKNLTTQELTYKIMKLSEASKALRAELVEIDAMMREAVEVRSQRV